MMDVKDLLDLTEYSEYAKNINMFINDVTEYVAVALEKGEGYGKRLDKLENQLSEVLIGSEHLYAVYSEFSLADSTQQIYIRRNAFAAGLVAGHRNAAGVDTDGHPPYNYWSEALLGLNKELQLALPGDGKRIFERIVKENVDMCEELHHACFKLGCQIGRDVYGNVGG